MTDGLVDLNTGYCTPKLVDSQFLYYWFLTIDFKQLYSGTALPTVSAKVVKNLNIAVPPIEEQKRIVKKLDHLIPLIDALR